MTQDKALAILKSGRNVFLTGSAGAGKTYVLNQYIQYLKDRKVAVAITASTGIAATHMNGQTIHSWSGMGIKDEMNPADFPKLKEKKYLNDHIQLAKVLIVDEISMLHKKQLNLLDKLMQYFKNSFEPFGGLQIIFSGDFFQLPPISKNIEEASKDKFAFMSQAWLDANLTICYITEQHRQSDATFNTILNEIRFRQLSHQSLSQLENTVYNKPTITPTKLFTHNIDVDRINEEHLMELSSDKFTFPCSTKGNEKLIEGLKRSVLAPEKLSIKIGAKVMFVRNNYENGYMNGTLGKVIDIQEDENGDLVPLVETFDKRRIYVGKEVWKIDDEKGRNLASFEQFPLRLAWAITVHKSQGMTLDAAEIDLSKTFETGQGYVALSRLKSLQGLQLLGANDMAFAVDDLAFKADLRFQALSQAAEDQLPFTELIKDFIPFLKKCGGLTTDDEIEKNKNKTQSKKNNISTFQQTKAMLEIGLPLSEITKQRGLTLGTIIGHIEKIKEEDASIDIENYKPQESTFKVIKKAHDSLRTKLDNVHGDGRLKLTVLHKHFKNKFTYDELRLAMLFL